MTAKGRWLMARGTEGKNLSVEDRVREIREDATGLRRERLARGNLRIQGRGATISSEEMAKRKEEQPERMARLNKALGDPT